jgi:hypothetical protein
MQRNLPTFQILFPFPYLSLRHFYWLCVGWKCHGGDIKYSSNWRMRLTVARLPWWKEVLDLSGLIAGQVTCLNVCFPLGWSLTDD